MFEFKRKITFILCFFIISSLFAQIKDDFQDGNFTLSPTWQGNTQAYTVNTKGWLQLAGKSTSFTKSYLSTAATYTDEAQWELTVKMSFNPSTHNYCRFYLNADCADLTKAATAYLVEMGWNHDKIVLYRLQNGRLTTLIQSEIPLLNASKNSFALRVIHHEKVWYLHYCNLLTDQTYRLVGSYKENAQHHLQPQKALGVMCFYTPSRSDKYYFDHLWVGSLSDVKEWHLQGGDLYNPTHDDPHGDPPPSKSDFQFGDIVFSEIMANPKGVQGLPPVEYIELYNRSDKAIDLSHFVLCAPPQRYALPNREIQPHTYLALCHDNEVTQFQTLSIEGMPHFPRLTNTGKTLVIQDDQQQTIAWVDYCEAWYGDHQPSEGVSLECKNVDCLLGGERNWAASQALSGGTPGCVNSLPEEKINDEAPRLTSAYLLASDTLFLAFNHPMMAQSLQSSLHYSCNDERRLKPVLMPAQCNAVKVALSFPLELGEVLSLTVKSLCDLAHQSIETQTLTFALAQEAQKGQILFNEILFNPPIGGCDYVEIYNPSSRFVALDSLFIAVKNPSGTLSHPYALSQKPQSIAPHSYACFTPDVDWVNHHYTSSLAHLYALPQLPAMPDDKGNLILMNTHMETIDAFSYTAKMHSALATAVEGLALEKINPTFTSQETSHWTSANITDRGTPGKSNSTFVATPSNAPSACYLASSHFSPNGDGYEDLLLIHYQFGTQPVRAELKIYDSAGRWVNDIPTPSSLSGKGTLSWNGKEVNGTYVDLGIYIIYVITFTEKGTTKTYKLVCAVGR